MSAGADMGCEATFTHTVETPQGALQVYRCSWGWYVKGETREARSRYLDEAFETVLGRPPDNTALRGMVDTLHRELTAERDSSGKTSSRTLLL